MISSNGQYYCSFTVKEGSYIRRRTKDPTLEIESEWLDKKEDSLMLDWKPSDGRTIFITDFPNWLKKVNKNG